MRSADEPFDWDILQIILRRLRIQKLNAPADRRIPVVAEVGRKVMEICPNALFLNYTNPMTVLTRTLAMQGVKVVGLCHEWIGVREKLAFIFNSEPENITARIAGVNHLIWVTDPCRASVDASHGGALVQLRYHSIVA